MTNPTVERPLRPLRPLFPLVLALVTAVGLSSCATLQDRFSRDDDGADSFTVDGDEIVMGADESGSSRPADVSGNPRLAYDTVLVQIEVNKVKRPIVIQLYPEAAPKTVANFKQKVLSGHYDGTAFHRVISRYIVQGGDPLSKDTTNRADWGTGGNDQTIPAEIKLPHRPGAVAMARLDDTQNPAKHSSASQFYIALRAIPALDGEYTVFGQVTQGLDVIEDLSRAIVDTNDNPVRRIEIDSMDLVPATVTAEDPGALSSVGARTNTIPDSKKGPFTRFFERIW
ncbi:N/A [soil metagenome]